MEKSKKKAKGKVTIYADAISKLDLRNTIKKRLQEALKENEERQKDFISKHGTFDKRRKSE